MIQAGLATAAVVICGLAYIYRDFLLFMWREADRYWSEY